MYKRWYLCHRDFRFLPHTFKQLGTETYPPCIPYGSVRQNLRLAARHSSTLISATDQAKVRVGMRRYGKTGCGGGAGIASASPTSCSSLAWGLSGSRGECAATSGE